MLREVHKICQNSLDKQTMDKVIGWFPFWLRSAQQILPQGGTIQAFIIHDFEMMIVLVVEFRNGLLVTSQTPYGMSLLQGLEFVRDWIPEK